jgi:hypothetical protein
MFLYKSDDLQIKFFQMDFQEEELVTRGITSIGNLVIMADG